MTTRRIKMSAWDCAITFVVDTDVLKQEELQEMHTFWMSHEERLAEFDGDLLYAVLSMIAKTALHEQFSNDYNLRGIISQFDYDDGGGLEGFCKMDGSHGIKIVSYEGLAMGDFTAVESEMSKSGGLS